MCLVDGSEGGGGGGGGSLTLHGVLCVRAEDFHHVSVISGSSSRTSASERTRKPICVPRKANRETPTRIPFSPLKRAMAEWREREREEKNAREG